MDRERAGRRRARAALVTAAATTTLLVGLVVAPANAGLLPPPVEVVEGTATASDTGAPMADVDVIIRDVDPHDGNETPQASTSTDSAGNYSFQLQSATYVIQFFPPAGHYTQTDPRQVAVSQAVTRVDQVIPREVTIVGTVTNKLNGQPIQGVCGNFGGCTDADGHYFETGIQPQQNTRVFMNVGSTDNPDYVSEFRFVQTHPGEVLTADFALYPTPKVHVIVTGADGRPAAGVHVVHRLSGLWPPGGPTTDANGELVYPVTLLPDSLDALMLLAPGTSDQIDAPTAAPVHLEPGATVDLSVQLPARVSTSITVRHSDGSLATDGSITLVPADVTSQYDDGTQVGVIDQDNPVTFTGLTPGVHTLTYQNDASTQSWPEGIDPVLTVDIPPGDSQITVTIPRVPVATVAGTVTDQTTHRPLVGVTVAVGKVSVQTGPLGRYRLDNLARDGDFTLRVVATPPDKVHTVVSRTVTASPDAVTTVNIALPLKKP